jgi:hypothetical protein
MNQMPVLKNPRHELFAQNLASGLTIVDAHEGAGFVRNDSNASRMARRDDVVARVTELKGLSATRTALKLEITTESLIAEAEEIKQLALSEGDYGAANTALREKAVLSGKWIEKTEVGSPNEFALIEAMSRAELIAFITESIESGKLALEHKPDGDWPVALLADK